MSWIHQVTWFYLLALFMGSINFWLKLQYLAECQTLRRRTCKHVCTCVPTVFILLDTELTQPLRKFRRWCVCVKSPHLSCSLTSRHPLRKGGSCTPPLLPYIPRFVPCEASSSPLAVVNTAAQLRSKRLRFREGDLREPVYMVESPSCRVLLSAVCTYLHTH